MPLLVDGYGARLLVDGALPPDLAAALRSALPPNIAVTASDATDDIDARFTLLPSSGEQLRIEQEGAEVAVARAGEPLAHALRTQLELAIALHGRTGTFVHAGVVGWRSKAVLVPGPSHAGKSTLIAELVRCGAVYLSDEYAVVGTDGRVQAYPRPLHLRETGEQLRLPWGAEPLEAGLIVSTIFRSGAQWAPAIRKGARALLPILDNVIVMKDRPEVGMDAAARLAPDLVTLTCERPDAAQVAPEILRFLDRMLDEPRAV